MSATRLLVLGAVRIFQPIHGYDLRRELMSWHADEWANISFGSIYFALKKMTGDRLLEEVETERSGGRPEKTLYRLTVEGEKEFQSLLREYFWRRKPLIDPFLVAMSQMPALPKPELIAALRHRANTARSLAAGQHRHRGHQRQRRNGHLLSDGDRQSRRSRPRRLDKGGSAK